MAWERLHIDRGGHRLYAKTNDTGEREQVPGLGRVRVWVGDGSGANPDYTDSGAIEIVPHTEVIVAKVSFGYLVAPIGCTNEDGDEAHVHLTIGCAIYLARLWGLQFMVEHGGYTLPINPLPEVHRG